VELLTVFTPTYNRRQLLTRLYSSLIIQSFKNFIWLIIDDGSNDDTSYYVKQWQTEDKIKIKYINQRE
jgi:glycosyltransferase involved in cell wall biosynthesis